MALPFKTGISLPFFVLVVPISLITGCFLSNTARASSIILGEPPKAGLDWLLRLLKLLTALFTMVATWSSSNWLI